MHAFTVHPQKPAAPPAPPAADKKPRRRKRWLLLLLLLLFLIGGTVWATRPDPHLARAKELQAELFSPEAKNLSPEDRKAKFEQYRAEVKNLTPEQKKELSEPMRAKMRADLERYHAMSQEEKARHLDEVIDRSEKMRKEREQRAKANGGQPGGGGPGGGGPRGGPGGGPGGGPNGPGGSRTAADIEKRRKERLDQSTPEERAMRDEFRRDLEARRKQRGLPPSGR
jgi:hypothetical protein